MKQKLGNEVFFLCDCPGCSDEADVLDYDGKDLCARCLIEYEDNGKLIDKTKYDEDGEPYEEG